MKLPVLRSALVLLCVPTSQLSADIVINEIRGRNPERLLKWSDAGQPSLGPGTAWFETGFDDSAWSSGQAPFGFGYGDIATDLAPLVQGKVPSFYLRKTFTAAPSQAASGTNLQIEAEYDDGFIAYLNGVEVARCNMGAPQMFIYADQFTFNSGSTSGNPEMITIGAASGLLVPGDNVLAVHVANRDVGTTIKFDSVLRLGGAGGGAVLVPAASSWSYTGGNVEPSGGVFEPAFLPGSTALEAEWAQRAFDDSSWATGAGPLGYDSGTSYSLGTNLIGQMRNITTSLYNRLVAFDIASR